MSNKNSKIIKDSNSEKIEQSFKLRDFIWVLMGIIIGILISYAIFALTLKNFVLKEINSTESDEQNKVTTYTLPSKIIETQEDISIAQKAVDDYISKIENNNTYSQVMIGEDQYIYYLYNDKGEIFSQDSVSDSIEVFLNNGTVFSYNDEDEQLLVGPDMDIVSIIYNAIHAIDKDRENVTLYEMEPNETNTAAGVEYRVDLKNDEAVGLLYDTLGTEFRDKMLENLKASLNDNVHIIISMFMGEDIKDSYCVCFYVLDNKEYVNWIFEGYDTVDAWALNDAWYEYDITKDTEDGELFSQLATDLVTTINNIMIKYSIENGMDITDYDTGEKIEINLNTSENNDETETNNESTENNESSTEETDNETDEENNNTGTEN